jgi:hypothetical protein
MHALAGLGKQRHQILVKLHNYLDEGFSKVMQRVGMRNLMLMLMVVSTCTSSRLKSAAT